MESKITKPLNNLTLLIAGGFIFFILFTGGIWYLQNYSIQVAQKEKVEYAEDRLNDLNEIYINFLKAIRDNRGYRLYELENREKDYLTHKEKVLLLLKDYNISSEVPQDTALFYKISRLIHLRFEDLDQQLVNFKTDPTYKRTREQLEVLDSIISELEQNHQALTVYWIEQSQLASKEFYQNNKRNDQLFLFWIIITFILAILFIVTYRRKLQFQLRQAITEKTLEISSQKEKEFSAAFDYASIGMALVGTEGEWLRVNKSLCLLLGYTEKELLELRFQDITHPEDLSTDLKYVEQMLRKEVESYQMEKRYYTKDGSLVWVLLSVSLVWKDENPIYFISQIQNITPQKNLQEELLNQKNRLQQIIDGTNAGTWEWNVQTGETNFNEKWANIIGYSLTELQPTDINTWIEFAHPEDLEASNQQLQDCFEMRSEIYECVCRMKHRSGEWIWVIDRGKVMTWTPDGKPEWMFGSHIEITPIKRLEKSLELQRNKFTNIFNSTFQFIGFLELDGTLLEVNETFIAFAGLEHSEVIGKKFWDCHWWQISKETQEKLKEAIQKAANGETISYEVAIWDKAKQPATILLNLKPLKDAEGKIVSIIPEGTLIQDLIDYRTKLETKNQELESFAAIAAHDLKEPIRMIGQFMNLLSKKYNNQLDELARKYINFAVDGANRMNILIDDLLTYAEVGGVRDDSFEQIDLNEVFEDTVRLRAASIEEANAIVIKDQLPIIRGNKTAMRLLFKNLIGNGLKYQKSGNQPVLKVGFNENEQNYTFSFSDNGIGIAKENQTKVFDLFTRLHSKSEYKGTGMGLATCKKIVELHKGLIWVESKKNEGTVFYFKIPKNI